MNTNLSPDVFNLQALAIGCATMLLCLAVQASFAHTVSLRFKPLIENYMQKKRNFAAQAIFLSSAIVLLGSHLLQIFFWGGLLYWTGVMPNNHQAMVFAGSTYTTVGFTNDTLPVSWQLVTIIMATSGLFSFGWSTSIMFLLAQTLYPSQRQ
jgi:hypothetical protein